MVARVGRLVETSVDVCQVEVQRWPEGASGSRHPGGTETIIGERLGGSERCQIPGELVVQIVLDVGHRVGDRTPMQRVAIATDLAPQRLEHRPGEVTVAMLTGRQAVAEAQHDRVGLGQESVSVIDPASLLASRGGEPNGRAEVLRASCRCMARCSRSAPLEARALGTVRRDRTWSVPESGRRDVRASMSAHGAAAPRSTGRDRRTSERSTSTQTLRPIPLRRGDLR